MKGLSFHKLGAKISKACEPATMVDWLHAQKVPKLHFGQIYPQSLLSNQFLPRACLTWPQQNSGLLIGGCFGPPGAWRVTGGQRQVVPWEGSGLAVAASPKSSCLCGAPRLVESQSWPLDYHWLVLAGLSTLFRLSTPLLRGMQTRSSKMNIAPVFNNSF